ncbi:hypothetical protein [Vibrio sp. HN007]|uniref:hypothetical protein n=1 Tax=Vibrio iocasae TaxID=3098914 RepID=UPI0035D527AF
MRLIWLLSASHWVFPMAAAVIINEAQKGRLTKHDAVITVLLLNLVHSVFEDTALILLLGADLNMILWGRIVFSIVATAIISHVYFAVVIKKERQFLDSCQSLQRIADRH